MTVIAVVCTVLALVPLVWITAYTLYRGIGAWDVTFFTSLPQFFGDGGGVRNGIVGTLFIVGMASVMGIPVGVSWNLGQPAVADRVIREELIDMAFLGRPALANPHWPVWAARELAHSDPFSLLPEDWSWWLRNRPGSENSHGWPAPSAAADVGASALSSGS